MTARGSRVLRTRIERLYRRSTGAHGKHGAYVWFARQIGVNPHSVYAWIKEDNPRMPRPPALLLLKNMEDALPTETLED